MRSALSPPTGGQDLADEVIRHFLPPPNSEEEQVRYPGERDLVTPPSGTQSVQRNNIVAHQLSESGRIGGGSCLVQLKRELGRNCGDARSVGTDTNAVVSGNTIIANATDPKQTVANMVDDLLVTPDVTLSILPCEQRRYLGG